LEVLTCCFFGREGFREVYSTEQVYLGKLGVVKIVLLRDDQQMRDLVHAEAHISAACTILTSFLWWILALRRRCRIW
jgi:hypothetical protein